MKRNIAGNYVQGADLMRGILAPGGIMSTSKGTSPVVWQVVKWQQYKYLQLAKLLFENLKSGLLLFQYRL